MNNLLRANLIRVFSGLSIYITICILLAVSTLIVLTTTASAVGNAFYGAETIQVIFNGMSNMVYLVLALAIFVSGAMFTSRAVENELAFGLSRAKIYFSHLILSSALCVVLVVLFIAWAVILGTILRGFGTVPQGFWAEKFAILGLQMLLLLAINALATFLVFTTRRTSVTIGAFFALILVPRFLTEMFAVFNVAFLRLRDFDIIHNLILAAQLSALNAEQIMQVFFLGVGIIVFTTSVGIVLFQWADIR